MKRTSKNPKLSGYIAAIRRYGVLEPEQERELVRRFREHQDQRAAEQLVCATLRHVVPVALKYLPSGEPLDDLIAEGNLGVLHALKKYDPSFGTRFATYARLWIRTYIGRYARRCRSMVSTPLHDDAVLAMKIRRMRTQAASRTSTERSDEHLAAKLNISVKKLRAVEHRFGTRDVSLEAPVSPDGGITLRDELAASTGDPFTKAVEHELEAMLRSAIEDAQMAPKERFVIEARLLSKPGEEPTLAEIGRRLNVTREWARRLEKRAFEKLDRELLALRASMSTP